jgi:hypothetical protein
MILKRKNSYVLIDNFVRLSRILRLIVVLRYEVFVELSRQHIHIDDRDFYCGILPQPVFVVGLGIARFVNLGLVLA